jgi:hypothetical protein
MRCDEPSGADVACALAEDLGKGLTAGARGVVAGATKVDATGSTSEVPSWFADDEELACVELMGAGCVSRIGGEFEGPLDAGVSLAAAPVRSGIGID